MDVIPAIKKAHLQKGEWCWNDLRGQSLESVFRIAAMEFDEPEMLRLLAQLDAVVAEAKEPPKIDIAFGNDAFHVMTHAASIFGQLAMRARNMPDALSQIGKMAMLDRYPLRIEPVVPVLVSLEIMSEEEALRRLRYLIRDDDSEAASVLIGTALRFLMQVETSGSFSEAVWRLVVLEVVARRPQTLERCLRSLAHGYASDCAPVPAELDQLLDYGLELILRETLPDQKGSEPYYDRFAVRFQATVLVKSMRAAGRGSSLVLDAWDKAIEQDALPDTRRAAGLR